MQQLEDFWAFSFELTNFHLFQQNFTATLHNNDVTDVMLVLMLLQIVIHVAPKVHWRVQLTAARFNKMHGAPRILHVSLNNSSTNIVRKCLKRNKDHLITRQVRIEWRYRVWEATHEAIWKPSSEAQNSFWIKSRTGKAMGQFSAGPLFNKAFLSFRNSLTSTLRVTEDILSIFLYSKKCSN